MKAKLIKRGENDYKLYVNEATFATSIEGPYKRLSLKNCQAIELGYDLDELAKIEYPICEVWNDEEALIRELAFKKGFQKALEILGNKKFSESDVREAIDVAWHDHDDNIDKTTIIQSLQTKEWDVEVCCYVDNANGWLDPKLDENNCLILKRI